MTQNNGSTNIEILHMAFDTYQIENCGKSFTHHKSWIYYEIAKGGPYVYRCRLKHIEILYMALETYHIKNAGSRLHTIKFGYITKLPKMDHLSTDLD